MCGVGCVIPGPQRPPLTCCFALATSQVYHHLILCQGGRHIENVHQEPLGVAIDCLGPRRARAGPNYSCLDFCRLPSSGVILPRGTPAPAGSNSLHLLLGRRRTSRSLLLVLPPVLYQDQPGATVPTPSFPNPSPILRAQLTVDPVSAKFGVSRNPSCDVWRGTLSHQVHWKDWGRLQQPPSLGQKQRRPEMLARFSLWVEIWTCA